MTLSTACPKPEKAVKERPRWLPRGNPPKRRAWLKHGTKPIPTVNRRAASRRVAKYRKVLASDFHKALRYSAYSRSGGLCECDECRFDRSVPNGPAHAWEQIPIWFTKKGGEPWRRFRSNDGELHHDSYKFFGEENPAELQHVKWVWKVCHRRIEAEHHTRRRFLRGR